MTEFKFLGKQPPSSEEDGSCSVCGILGDCPYCALDHYRGALKEAANAIKEEIASAEPRFYVFRVIERNMRVSLGEVDEK